jgi:hypothetical protein
MKVVQFNTTGLPIVFLVELKRFLGVESPEIVWIHCQLVDNFILRIIQYNIEKIGSLISLLKKMEAFQPL